MTSLILAAITNYSLIELAIGIVILAAVCAVVFIGLQAMKIEVPSWVKSIVMVVVIAVFVIIAIRFLASL